jgi:PAS domain S-box-containing protein
MTSNDAGGNIAAFPLASSDDKVRSLIAIIRRLATARSTTEIMETVTHAARALLNADGITFVLREHDLCHYADEYAIAPLWKGLRFPMSACISGWCMTHDQAVRVPDISQDPRIPQDAYRPTFVRSLAMVPVRHQEPIAAIGAYWSMEHYASDDELALLQTIANASGLAISAARRTSEAEAATAQYQAVFNQAAVGVARVSPDGRFLEVNDRFCLIAGRDRAELLRTDFQAITHPEDLSADVDQAAALLAGDLDTYSMEKRYVRRNGDPVWVNLTCSLVRSAGGEPNYFIAVIEDISQRKASELEQSRLLGLIERSADIVSLADTNCRLLYMNRAGREMLGLEDVAIGTVSFADYVTPDCLDVLIGQAMPTAERSGVWRGEMQLTNRKTGHVVDVSRSIFAVRDDAGTLTGFGSIAKDITGLKAAAAAERARADEFHALVDNIPALCWTADADGRDYWFNLRWCEYTGLEPEDPAGWERSHHPDVASAVRDHWRACLQTGEPFEMTFPLRARDGSYRAFLTRIVPIREEGGRIVRWFGSSTDVADQQRHEEHLKLLVNELNHRVKNTLVTVQSMAAQTLRHSGEPQEAFAKFEGRLLSLSAAHNVLTERNWEGANVREVAERALRPFVATATERVRLQGPDVWLPPQVAVALSLAFHELATNAVKYGALSNAEGRVELEWTLSGAPSVLDVTWTERNGPPVVPPSRRGFGSRLIERNLGREWEGEASLSFEPSGIVCRIRLQLGARDPLGWPGRPH